MTMKLGQYPTDLMMVLLIYEAGSDQLVGILEGVTNVSLEDDNIFGWA